GIDAHAALAIAESVCARRWQLTFHQILDLDCNQIAVTAAQAQMLQGNIIKMLEITDQKNQAAGAHYLIQTGQGLGDGLAGTATGIEPALECLIELHQQAEQGLDTFLAFLWPQFLYIAVAEQKTPHPVTVGAA